MDIYLCLRTCVNTAGYFEAGKMYARGLNRPPGVGPMGEGDPGPYLVRTTEAHLSPLYQQIKELGH